MREIWHLGDPQIPDDISQSARELGPLESPIIWWTLAKIGFVLLAVAVGLWHDKRIRGWSLPLAICCLLLAAITALNSYVGYVRTPNDLSRLLERGKGPVYAIGQLLDNGENAPKPPSSGTRKPDAHQIRTERISITDPANAIPSGTTYVTLPPGYDDPVNAGRTYPVVYLIHGYPFGGPTDWMTSGDSTNTIRQLIETKTISPMIVVSVDMTAGNPSKDWECLDIPGGPKLETYLSQTVVSTIDQHYRTIPNRLGRALGGMSGGAFGALNIGLHHVDKFSVLLNTLPYDDPDTAKGFFKNDQKAIKANTPRDYLPTMHFSAPVSVIFAAGTDAPTDVTTSKRIAAAFTRQGQEAVVHLERGLNHTWHTARATLPYLLAFADQHFPK